MNLNAILLRLERKLLFFIIIFKKHGIGSQEFLKWIFFFRFFKN